MTPSSRAELLYLGGIGTYVKAKEQETPTPAARPTTPSAPQRLGTAGQGLGEPARVSPGGPHRSSRAAAAGSQHRRHRQLNGVDSSDHRGQHQDPHRRSSSAPADGPPGNATPARRDDRRGRRACAGPQLRPDHGHLPARTGCAGRWRNHAVHDRAGRRAASALTSRGPAGRRPDLASGGQPRRPQRGGAGRADGHGKARPVRRDRRLKAGRSRTFEDHGPLLPHALAKYGPDGGTSCAARSSPR